MTHKLLILSSVALLGSASFASAAAGGSETRYVARRVQQGPSHWGIVLVPVWQDQAGRQPYALMGRSSSSDTYRAAARAKTMPWYARGTHGW